MLLLALQWGGTTFAWNSSQIIGLFCGSACTFVVFFMIEIWRGDAAMLPLVMFRMRVVVCAGVTAFISGGSTFLLSYYLPVWFQVVKGVSPTIGGVHFLPSLGAVILASMFTGAFGKSLPSNSHET